MRRKVSTSEGAKPSLGAHEHLRSIDEHATHRHAPDRVGINVVHVLDADGSESGTVVVTCPSCRRSLPLDETTVSAQFAESPLDRPRSAPSFLSGLRAPAPLRPALVASGTGGAVSHRERSIRFGFGRIPSAAHTPISTVMTRDVVCVRQDLSVEDLTRLFLEHGLHGAPVLDKAGALAGFVSMTDILRHRRDRGDTEEAVPLRVSTRSGGSYELGDGFHVAELAGATVAELMMPLAISLEESASLTMAAALMAFEGVHRVPVVSDTGHVVGILSALDLLRWLAREDGYAIPSAAQPDRRRPCA